MKVSQLGTDLLLSGVQSPSLNGAESKSKRIIDSSQSVDKLPEIKEHGNRSMSSRLATKVERVHHDTYNLHMTEPYPVQGEVYSQAGAKLNIYERQRAELREIVRNDPNNFYTYSANYLALSIDPYSPEEIKRLEEENNKKLWRTKNGFQTVLRKDKHDYIVHPKKPHESKVDELHTYPWHQSKLEETKQLTNTRGEAIRNGPDFKLQILGNKFFSTPEILEEEKISVVERERRKLEAKKKAEEEWKAKMKVDNPYFKTSLCMDRNSQLDKIKGMREGDALKKGIMLNDKRLRTSSLGMIKAVQDNPISMYLAESWVDNATRNFFERQVDTTKAVSHYDFKTFVGSSNPDEMIYKPMKEIFD